MGLLFVMFHCSVLEVIMVFSVYLLRHMYSICTVYVQYLYASKAYIYCTYTVQILYICQGKTGAGGVFNRVATHRASPRATPRFV